MAREPIITIPRPANRLGIPWFLRQWPVLLPMAMLTLGPLILFLYLRNVSDGQELLNRFAICESAFWALWILWSLGMVYLAVKYALALRREFRLRNARWDRALRQLAVTVKR